MNECRGVGNTGDSGVSVASTPAERYGALGPGRIEGLRIELNIRDLGGYETADGRHVRHGLLLRGGPLLGLTDEEAAIVGGLGIQVVLDLRARGEAAANPDHVPSGADYLRVGGMYYPGTREEVDFSPDQIAKLDAVLREGTDPGDLGMPDLSRMYASMVFDNPGMRELIKLVAQGRTPVYFHCSAGKDRTGMGAALLLLALGVSREDALFDYGLTNTYREAVVEQDLARMANVLREHPEVEEHLRARQGVSVPMMAATLDLVIDRYGSFETYFEQEFALDAAALGRLRDTYTA